MKVQYTYVDPHHGEIACVSQAAAVRQAYRCGTQAYTTITTDDGFHIGHETDADFSDHTSPLGPLAESVATLYA